MTDIEELQDEREILAGKLELMTKALKLFEKTTGMVYSPKIDALVDKDFLHYEP